MLRVSLRNSDALETAPVLTTIFKTSCETLKTGLVTDAQQTKRYVFCIPHNWGRCFICVMRRLLEVCFKEYKHNLTKGLLEKSKAAQHEDKKSHRICWKDKVLQTEPNTTYTKSTTSLSLWYIIRSANPICTHLSSGLILSQKKKNINHNSVQCWLFGKVDLYAGAIMWISPVATFTSESSTVQC
jgi:hypothetical protein